GLGMAKEALEARILSKVTPLERPHEFSKQTDLPHNHQKGKQCRACRTLRRLSRDEKEAAQLRILQEATVGSVTALVFTVGETGKALIEGTFGIGKAIAENPD